MGVTLDAAGPSSTGFVNTATPTASPQTWAHVVGASATALLAWFAIDNPSTEPTVSATAGGTSMTALAGSPVANNGAGWCYAFGLLNPPTGSITISVTQTSNGQDCVTGGSISFDGATAFGTPVTVASKTGASHPVTVTGTAASSLIAAFQGIGDPPLSVTSPAIDAFKADGLGSSGATNANSNGATSAGGGDVTVTWAGYSGTDTYAMLAVEVQGSSVTSGPPLGGQSMARAPAVTVSSSGWRNAAHSR